MRVAIIGAGMAGLSCASSLKTAGVDVTVFDKGRGPAGRVSTRRAPVGVDHGAQYFTVRHPDFEALVAEWVLAGHVAQWQARIIVIDRLGGPTRLASTQPRYVGVPGMNALALALAAGLDVRQAVTVTRLDRREGRWHLTAGDEPLGAFDVVVVTAPPVQTAALLGEAHPLTPQVRQATLAPCWAAMAAWDAPLDVAWDAAFVNDGPIGWVARNGSKPGRTHAHAWVLHASPAWSTTHLEGDRTQVAAQLIQAFADMVGAPLAAPTWLDAHRWRYASVTQTLDDRSLWDAGSRVGVAGDYCRGPRVEGAWLSGQDLARRILSEP